MQPEAVRAVPVAAEESMEETAAEAAQVAAEKGAAETAGAGAVCRLCTPRSQKRAQSRFLVSDFHM